MMISFLYRREPVSGRSGLSSIMEQKAAFVRLQFRQWGPGGTAIKKDLQFRKTDGMI